MRKAAILILISLLGGCAPIAQPVAGCDSRPIQLEQIDLNIKIASVSTGAAASVAAMGAGSSLIGQDLGSDLGLPTLNPGHQIDLEGLLTLRPDLVFASKDEPDEQALAAIAKTGAKIEYLDPVTTLQESYGQITQIAAALGIPERGAKLIELIEAEFASLGKSGLEGKRIAFLYLRGNAGVYLLGGEGAGSDDVIALLGGVDVGSEMGVKGFAPISAEALTEANPDFVLVMRKGLESVGGVAALVTMPGVVGTNAASPERILVGDDAELLSFGPQTPRVLRCLAAQ